MLQPPQGLPTDAAVGKGRVWGTRLGLGQPLDMHLVVSDKPVLPGLCRRLGRKTSSKATPQQFLCRFSMLRVCKLAPHLLQVKSQSQLGLVLLSVSCHSVAHPVNMLQFIDDPCVMLAGPTTGG